ncbi:MAG: ribonuclease III [Thermodesulfovibrionales bacterium]
MPVYYSEDFESLERNLGYSFRDRGVLMEALTHKSFHHENPDRAQSYNERLEFLGDSVLSLVIVEHLFNYSKEFTEAVMSKVKSYLVRGSILSEVAAELSLGRYLRLGRGEEDTGGRRKKSILANAMEAVFGAVYLDGDYKAAREVILGLFRERIESVISSGQYHDYKTELQEKSQMLFGILPEYRVISQEGEEHHKVFTVDVYIADKIFGRGIGKNKKEAQMIAAKEAMERLET